MNIIVEVLNTEQHGKVVRLKLTSDDNSFSASQLLEGPVAATIAEQLIIAVQQCGYDPLTKEKIISDGGIILH